MLDILMNNKSNRKLAKYINIQFEFFTKLGAIYGTNCIEILMLSKYDLNLMLVDTH